MNTDTIEALRRINSTIQDAAWGRADERRAALAGAMCVIERELLAAREAGKREQREADVGLFTAWEQWYRERARSATDTSYRDFCLWSADAYARAMAAFSSGSPPPAPATEEQPPGQSE